MIIRFRIWKYRFTFTLAPVTDVVGVNSKTKDGRHILMWDLDELYEEDAIFVLREIQRKMNLPNIYLLKSSEPDHYIAYSLHAVDWFHTKMIIASTWRVDENFFKYGVYRGYFTLRVSQKRGETPTLIEVLESDVPETASIWDLDSWVVYETLDS